MTTHIFQHTHTKLKRRQLCARWFLNKHLRRCVDHDCSPLSARLPAQAWRGNSPWGERAANLGTYTIGTGAQRIQGRWNIYDPSLPCVYPFEAGCLYYFERRLKPLPSSGRYKGVRRVTVLPEPDYAYEAFPMLSSIIPTSLCDELHTPMETSTKCDTFAFGRELARAALQHMRCSGDGHFLIWWWMAYCL